MAGSHVDIQKHVRAYVAVFVALAVLTVITVAVSTVHFRGMGNILVALLIAACKATLVAAIFMHLKWEKAPPIWWVLAACAVLFLVLVVVPVLTTQDMPPQVVHSTWDP